MATELPKLYLARHGDDMPEIAGWRLGQQKAGGPRVSDTVGDNV
jgi:hypothetical protein